MNAVHRISIVGLLAALLLPAAAPAAERPDPELRDILRKAANEVDTFPDRFEAEVWLTDMSRRLERQVRDPEERIEILTLVHYEASRVELPPELILAVIEVESNFDRYAISVAGAIGLMQIMPFWLDEIGRPDDNLLHIAFFYGQAKFSGSKGDQLFFADRCGFFHLSHRAAHRVLDRAHRMSQ